MREGGLFARRYFYPLISEFSTYRGLPSATKENLPVAHQLAEAVICLPMYHSLTLNDAKRIIDSIVL